VVNLGLNLVLVPTLGIRGAALSLLISSTLSALVLGWIYHRRVEAFRLGLRGPSMALAVILPMALPLLVPVGLRLPAALLGLPLLALGARVSGLVSAQDIARIRGGMVPGARPTSPPA
jgi:O-antigen/teichoic acid export membrane protein